MFALKLVSTLNCPVCGHESKPETMPNELLSVFLQMYLVRNPVEAKGGRLLPWVLLHMGTCHVHRSKKRKRVVCEYRAARSSRLGQKAALDE